MRTRRFRRVTGAVTAWAVVLGCLPAGGASAGPVPSSNGKVTTVRDEDVVRIETILADPRLVKALARRGIEADDLRGKLGRMSDHEVHMLAERLETAKSGAGPATVGLIILGIFVLLPICYWFSMWGTAAH